MDLLAQTKLWNERTLMLYLGEKRVPFSVSVFIYKTWREVKAKREG